MLAGTHKNILAGMQVNAISMHAYLVSAGVVDIVIICWSLDCFSICCQGVSVLLLVESKDCQTSLCLFVWLMNGIKCCIYK